MILHYNDTIAIPLSSDDLIEERVSALIGRASRRQLWFLFLDANDAQLPLIMPFTDPPITPDCLEPLARIIEQVMNEENAQSVVVVIERCADETFSQSDRLWARAISQQFQQSKIAVRCVMISHCRGVRWFATDDYAFERVTDG